MPSDATAAWEAINCRLYSGPPIGAAVGLATLAGDTVIESELRTMLPIPDLGLYTTRVGFPPSFAPDQISVLQEDVRKAASLLVPGERLDVMAFGCTSGTVAIGPEQLAASVEEVRPGTRFANPVTAAFRAFAALGVRRVALLTPYTDAVNALMFGFIRARGIEVAACAAFRAPASLVLGRTPPARIPPEEIREAAVAIGRSSRADCVFVSCTGLRCSPVIDSIEQEIGKPVVTSNQALAWHIGNLVGKQVPQAGFGRLLSHLAQERRPPPKRDVVGGLPR